MRDMIPQLIIMAVPVLFCITIHEFSHGYVAYRLGDPTAKLAGRLTLNPFKHVDIFGLICLFIMRLGWAKPVPVDSRYFKNPKRDMLLVSLAGPASNMIFAVLFALVFHLVAMPLGRTAFYPLVIMIQYTVYLNVALAVFNLLPIPPLDGGHILEGLLPPDKARALSQIGPYGMIILLLLVFSGALGKIIVPIISAVVRLLGIPI